MNNFRILVIILLLAIAAPFIVHRRGWAIAGSGQSELAVASQSTQPSAVRIFSSAPPSPAPPAGDLPSGDSSLPLLSVIGFGILVGGVISALRTRSAHK